MLAPMYLLQGEYAGRHRIRRSRRWRRGAHLCWDRLRDLRRRAGLRQQGSRRKNSEQQRGSKHIKTVGRHVFNSRRLRPDRQLLTWVTVLMV
jgi:hypothetical protein